MKPTTIIQFYIEADPQGGYTAQAVGYSVYTEGDTLDETVKNIQEAVACHFGGEGAIAQKYSVPIMVNFALPAMA